MKLGIIGIVVVALAAANFGASVRPTEAACGPYGCVPGPFIPGGVNCATTPYLPFCHPVVRPVLPYVPAPVVNPYIVNNCVYSYNCIAPGYVTPLNTCNTGYGYYGVAYNNCGPAHVNLAVNPSVLGCGSGVATVSASVTTWSGGIVPNGTPVTFSTSLGTISSSAVTLGGTATATLQVPANVSGTAIINVSSDGGSGSTTIAVVCNQQPPAVAAYVAPVRVVTTGTVYQQAPAAPAQAQIYYPPSVQRAPRFDGRPGGAPGFLPPRTGDAGLLNIVEPGDGAANAALVQAFDHPYDSVYEAAQASNVDDAIVVPDDSAANSSLFGFSGSLVTQGSNFASA
jgi:hypothetical protein